VFNLPGPSADAPSVLDGANLVYCAPTSGGVHKSATADSQLACSQSLTLDMLASCQLRALSTQCEVLNLPGPSTDAPSVLDGANLVYCAPTSGGKSLVAEVLMLRRICETNRPALLVR
jgi:hypothetical protein